MWFKNLIVYRMPARWGVTVGRLEDLSPALAPLVGAVVQVPPLRERPDDVLPLARHLAHQVRGREVGFTPAAEQALRDHAWPGNVAALRLTEVEMVDGRPNGKPGTEREIPAQLVLFAMGFLGPQGEGVVEQLGVDLDERSNVRRDKNFMSSVPGVFVAGDAGRGQSLIVWAIAEGRAAAAGVDAWLTGSSSLPRPIGPTDRPLTV